jgi:RDD family protein
MTGGEDAPLGMAKLLATLWAGSCPLVSLLFPPCYGRCELSRDQKSVRRDGVSGHRNRPDTLGAMADRNPAGLEMSRPDVASFGRRFVALLIDWLIVTVIAALIVDSLQRNPWPQLGLFVLVHAFFVGLFGRTLGMAIMGLRCLSIIDGGAIGIPRALLRGVLLALVVPALINDGDGRGLHDRAAKSVMVRA